MTTETNHQCPACGAELVSPQVTQPPEAARTAYLIEYHAPAGVFRDLISAATPPAAIHYAQDYRGDLIPGVRVATRAVQCSQLKHQLARALNPARAAAYLS